MGKVCVWGSEEAWECTWYPGIEGEVSKGRKACARKVVNPKGQVCRVRRLQAGKEAGR